MQRLSRTARTSLPRRPHRSPARRERGAVTIIFAITLTFGVVLGMLALSVDIGTITIERRQLQNGADATSFALAQTCAKDAGACDPNATRASLELLASANAGDNLARLNPGRGINGQCARQPSPATLLNMPLCPSAAATGAQALAATQDLGQCPPLPKWLRDDVSIPYVETYTMTRSTQPDDTVLPRFFSQALAGGGASPTTVSACARAAWGPPARAIHTLPMVASYCDWNFGSTSGSRYAPSGPYSPLPANSSTPLPGAISAGNFPIVIKAHDSSKDGTNICGKRPNGAYYPGGFGWTQDDGTCNANLDATGTILPGKQGASVPTPCKDALQSYVGQEVFIPVMTAVNADGSYVVEGIASFFLAGYKNAPSAQPKSYSVYQEPAGLCPGKCNGSVTYIWGWFTSGVRAVGGISSGPSRGASVVVQAG